MKNKPTRHKEENTFKFQPFAERIANIDVDIFHRVAHEYETDAEEGLSYFSQCIEKWNVLNLTESYDDFKKDVKAQTIITLPQLLLNKEHVVEVLLKHLRLKNPLCLQPLLDITVAVARDLRKEFYVYYKDFLEVLIDLLNTKDTEQLEWTFTCLAYMFKFLWRSLIKNVGTVFIKLVPLLSDSKPEYINNFAAESFAFVARKVKDRKAFLELIVKSVRNKDDGITGCGKLLFEVINGVNGQFHSCAEVFLPSYLEVFCDPETQEIMFQIMEHIVANIATKINPQRGELLWKNYTTLLQNLFATLKTSESKCQIETTIDKLLVLVGETIEHRNGRFLYNPNWFLQEFSKLEVMELSESVLLTYCKICILLLLSANVKLTQEQASAVTREILNLDNERVLLYFIENTTSYSSFEAMILPHFLKMCYTSNLSEEHFRVLAVIILKKSPLSCSGINLDSWKKYPIDFINQDINQAIYTLIVSHIKHETIDSILTCIENVIFSLICLPHLIIKDSGGLEGTLDSMILKICTVLKDELKCIRKLLFLLNIALECRIHISNNGLEKINTEMLDTLMPFVKRQEYISSLKTLDLLLSSQKDSSKIISKDVLLRLHTPLEENFSSPFHELRLLTSHIYSLFEDIPELNNAESNEGFQVFSICYKVESTEPQVQTVREQLHCLEKLTHSRPQTKLCENTEFRLIPVRYLCGVLYINFKLLWEPTLKIIESYATGMKRDVFWDFFGEKLKLAVENIAFQPELANENLESSVQVLNELFENSHEVSAKPDFCNYRMLLWKAMTYFPDIAESKTRDISELFLNFMGNEYLKGNADAALTWNIKQNTTAVPPDSLVDEEDKPKIEENEPRKIQGGKIKLRTLICKLQLLSKMRNPKMMYREPELNKLYFDLLSHKNSEVQKLALTCITTYKHKYLTPYQENLFNLIDDKNFKNELIAFRVDQDSSLVQSEHRKDLIPLVMQIVFSKMSAKTGLRTKGKASGQLRRNLVLRFLAGCRENEMLTFIEKAFRIYAKYVQDNPKAMVQDIMKSVNLEKFVPPKRLQSSINLLTLIFQHFGGLMGTKNHRYLLNILLALGAIISGALNKITDVHAGYLPILRELRNASMKVVTHFFEHFDNYPWTSDEIDAVFEAFVWPYLTKLSSESIHSPTPLLKLFVQWSCNPRYFQLLVKHLDNDENTYPLKEIIDLLLNPKSSVPICNAIMEILEKLVSLQADADEQNIKIPVSNALAVKKDILDRLPLNDNLNYGSCILLPHAPKVLEKLKHKLEKGRNIQQKEMFILSRISELVWESDISDQLLDLLLPIVLKKCSRSICEEIVQQLLTTLSNLMQNVNTPLKHLRKIAPLFGVVSYTSGRKLLCEILDKIKAKHDEFIMTADLMRQFNAWDKRWIDQPDFDKRLEAFQTFNKLCEDKAVDLNLGILVIHHCYYTVSKESDLSAKESVSDCLKVLAPYLVKLSQSCQTDLDCILNDTLFAMIRSGIKSRDDELRGQCISLLGCIARECPDAHVVLQDLNKFTNKSDMDADCFENLTHPQLYRHARTLLKFSQILKEQKSIPNSRTLTQFLLPLTTHYLCAEKYAGKNSVIDAAIESMGTISRLLPWHQYEGLLKFYLRKLRSRSDFQKQLVRLTVAILDAFHFDLGKGEAQEMIKEKEIEKGIEESAEEKKEVSNEHKKEEDSDDLEELEKDMESGDQEMEEDEEEVSKESTEVQPACDKITVLCKSAANRVTRTIKTVLLPQLHKSLAELTHYEESHKVNRKRTAAEQEEEDLIRVPISLAMVKLLQRLPKGMLETHLGGVFMKMCTFLKSHLESVRRITRETLQKIMLALGPEYLRILLGVMTPLLNRGYQVHVLVYTIHGVLNCLKEMYKPGDINKILLTVLHICKADLFGILAEEKEVVKIVRKISEAKAAKSYNTFKLLAQYVTESCLLDLVLPVKEVLLSSHSFKLVHKAQESLRHISLGLVENQFVSVESLLKFAYGVASESIPELLVARNKSKSAEDKKNEERVDCFILPKDPGRTGAKQQGKLSAKTNAHVLVEFGLKLCYLLLKKEKVKEVDYVAFLDPFVHVFKNCLQSQHVKLSTYTLQCLGWIMRYELPSLKKHIKEIAELIFAILHKYAASGLSKGDNFDLVVSAFKAVSILVREVKYHRITTEQLKVLLLYAEQDMHDHDRQATAFGLLKAIISRKLPTPEIHATMRKVSELSITSELTHVRLQARLVCHQFIMEYPIGKKLEDVVSFYLLQLDYEMQSGRESALEMIQGMINSFPMDVLKEYSGTFLITLGARLVNDDVPECRKMAADCLKSMFTRLSRPDRDSLFDIIVMWFKDKTVSHRRLAAQICGIFISVEKASFETRIPILMPLIHQQFEEADRVPGQFVLLKKSMKEDENHNEEKERVKDHHLFQVLQMLLKLSAQCPAFLKKTSDIESLAINAQMLLTYPHEWVRLAAAQFIGFVLSLTDIDHLAKLLTENKCEDSGYLLNNPKEGLKSLTLDLCGQLQPEGVKADLAEQVVKNLVFVARVLQKAPLNESGKADGIDLVWLVRRMRKIVNMEVVVAPTSTVLRTEVFKWIAGVATILDKSKIQTVLHHLLAPLVREMLTTDESNAPLRQLANQVAKMLKKRVERETYTAMLNKLQQQLAVRRAERKRTKRQLAVTDPEVYAKKKIKRHEKKKETKKRKMEEMKGKKRGVKRRKIVDLESDEIF